MESKFSPRANLIILALALASGIGAFYISAYGGNLSQTTLVAFGLIVGFGMIIFLSIYLFRQFKKLSVAHKIFLPLSIIIFILLMLDLLAEVTGMPFKIHENILTGWWLIITIIPLINSKVDILTRILAFVAGLTAFLISFNRNRLNLSQEIMIGTIIALWATLIILYMFLKDKIKFPIRTATGRVALPSGTTDEICQKILGEEIIRMIPALYQKFNITDASDSYLGFQFKDKTSSGEGPSILITVRLRSANAEKVLADAINLVDEKVREYFKNNP